MEQRDQDLHREQQAREGAALYVVATPIGNLGDVTLRALAIIRSCEHVFAEDTRVSRKLLAHHGIARTLRALHQHSPSAELERVIELLQGGQSVAYLTDAGTPGVSDPGAKLVRRCLELGLRTVPIPGPSAVCAAVSVSGIESASWLFVGFLPSRGGARRSALESLAGEAHALVLYEAPHRIEETVADLARVLDPERALTVCRELTKLHEGVVRLPLGEAARWFAADAHRVRGEIVLVIDAPAPSLPAAAESTEVRRVVATLLAELPAGQAARLAARITGAGRDEAYRQALALKPEYRS